MHRIMTYVYVSKTKHQFHWINFDLWMYSNFEYTDKLLCASFSSFEPHSVKNSSTYIYIYIYDKDQEII